MADLRSQYGIGRGDISYDPNSISMYGEPATASYTPPYTETPAATAGSELLPQYYQNIQSALSGELPEDVKNQISTAAAEYGVLTGMPGSQLAGYAGLRNLGLTSLARQDWAAKMLQPNISSQLDINRLKTQAELEQENWMQRYEAQLAEKRRQDYLNKNLGGGTPPIVQGHAGVPSAPMMGGGYRPSSSGYGTGFGTFGTAPPTSNQAVMQSIMNQYNPYAQDADIYNPGYWSTDPADYTSGSWNSGISSYSLDWTIPSTSTASPYAADTDIYNPNYWTGDFGEGIYG